MKLVAFILVLLIQGCASTPDPRSSAEKKLWDNAYDNVVFTLAKNKKDDTVRMIALTKEYPEIVNYGYSTFSKENLKNWSDKDNMIAYQKYSLEYFCIISTDEQCKTATDNLDAVVKTIKDKLTVPKDLYAQLTVKEQQKLSEAYRLSFYESSEIGIVTDRNVRTINTPGSNAGAEIGGAIGTAAYINNATPSSYSMKSDLGSTAAGALVGALLMNKSPTTQYVTTHTIKLRNGEVKTIEQVDNKPTGEGIGTCVRVSVISSIDQSFCTMTMTEFRKKFYKELNS